MKTEKTKSINVSLGISTGNGQNIDNCYFVIPENTIDVIKKSKGINVTIMDGDKPLFHCFSNTLYESMIDTLDETELVEIKNLNRLNSWIS